MRWTPPPAYAERPGLRRYLAALPADSAAPPGAAEMAVYMARLAQGRSVEEAWSAIAALTQAHARRAIDHRLAPEEIYERVKTVASGL